MTATEKSLLDAFLEHDFVGADVLRHDAANVKVVPSCGCGCGSIRFVLSDRDEFPSVPEHPVPVEATVVADDRHPVGGLLLFEKGGRLRELEVYSFEDEPLSLPDLGHVVWETVER
jgi:hypothetical protein